MLGCLRSTVLPSVACTIGLVLVTGVASGVALADQTARQLPGLFDQLLDATDDLDERTLENELWQHWLAAPDQSSELLMSQVSCAMAAGELVIALVWCNQLIE